jgi:hypothetical protein
MPVFRQIQLASDTVQWELLRIENFVILNKYFYQSPEGLLCGITLVSD